MAAENGGPIIVGVLTMNVVLSWIFVCARVFTRTVIRPQFGADDALIIVTLLLFTGFSTTLFVAVHYGFGRAFLTLPFEQAQQALRASVAGEVLAVWTYPTGKAAVAYLLMRLFPGKTLKWTLWIFVAANAVFFYLNGVFILAQCSPVQYQWDKMIPGGTCWSPEFLVDWGYITGSVGAATDFVFAIIPWFYVARLEMSTHKKLAIGAALSTGLFPFVCSILKIEYTFTLGANADPTYSTMNLVLAGNAELCAINIAACIPTLGPLYFWCRDRDTRPSPSKRFIPMAEESLHESDLKRRKARRFQSPTEILLSTGDDKSEERVSIQPRSSGSGFGDHSHAQSRASAAPWPVSSPDMV